MRSLMRAAAVAVALVCVVPAAPALAFQAPTQAATWVVVPLQQLPAAVRATQKKIYPTAKITKVERLGAGQTAQYRLTMTGGKKADAIFTAAGKAVAK